MCFKLFSKKKQTEPFASNNLEPFSSRGNDPIVERADDAYVPQNDDYSYNFNSGFTLTEFGGAIEEGFRETKNPTDDELKNAVDNLVLHDGDMFTLISDEPINGYTLVGGMIMYGETSVTASVHVRTGVKNGKELGKSYDKKVTADGMLQLLKDFSAGRTPNIHDGTWVFDEDLEYPDSDKRFQKRNALCC
ncbi:MAG: hypothetical protein NC037_02030 [Bacteroides sp.]|nr:hypothetical protein [Bacillota bacterium]MCM1393472.1 hypothetical protein [[Eubacterium] siraeum]MCM1455294.1 hypothetical protein [Bacteroides sp.]